MRNSLQIIDITRRAASLLLALALLIPAPAAAQTRRGQSPQRKGGTAAPANGSGKGAVIEIKVDLTKLVPSPKSSALGAAYASGRLPSPAPLPAGNVEEQALALAARFGGGDEGSPAALYAAIPASGFSVREEGGGVRRPTGGAGQGLVLDAWQVAALAKLYGDGYGVGLDRLGRAHTRTGSRRTTRTTARNTATTSRSTRRPAARRPSTT